MHQAPRVLVVDDEAEFRQVVREMLRVACSSVETAGSAAEAMSLMQAQRFDVIVADLCMPGERGTTLLQYAAMHGHDPAVVIVSGKPQLQDAVTGLRLHASDFLVKPFSGGAIRTSVRRAYEEVQTRRSSKERELLSEAELARLEALVAALEACEHDTFSHSLRMREYSVYLAQMIGYPMEKLLQLSQSALLHDIGKIAIPHEILWKPGKLTSHEFSVMKTHVAKGVAILNRLPSLNEAASIVHHHHECYNGSGYPDGIACNNIPLGARIFSLVDTLDAMTSDRCYRKALSFSKTQEEIRHCSGTQFDPQLVEAFLAVPKEQWTLLRARATSDAATGWKALRRGLFATPMPPWMPSPQRSTNLFASAQNTLP